MIYSSWFGSLPIPYYLLILIALMASRRYATPTRRSPVGEVGLGGEVRSVPNLEQRLHEAERIGFERAVIPKHSLAHLNAADYPGMKLVGAAYIADAINALKNDRL